MPADSRNSSKGARLLALIPFGVAIALGPLALPRATAPDAIPLPHIDAHALADTTQADRARAEKAKTAGISGELKLLGTAFRDFQLAQMRKEGLFDDSGVPELRSALDSARVQALQSDGIEGLLVLRAYQLETFLAEVARYEKGAAESPELHAVAGPFIERMRDAGWVNGPKVLMAEPALRAAYKQMWNAVVQVGGPEFAMSLDEVRSLYQFYLLHPRVEEHLREHLESARSQAKTAADCERHEGRVRGSMETWRLDKIRKLGVVDPSFPLAFAVGVAEYRRGQFGPSMAAFREWLEQHPRGPLALRAQNHLRAAILADRAY